MEHYLPRPPLALVVITQSLLGILFLAAVGAIALLPGFSANVATTLPEYAELRSPLLAITIAITALALISLVMIAILIQQIHRGTVLTRSSLLWVDVIVAALACAVALVLISFVVISNGQAGSPFLALIQVTACLILFVLVCVTLVLRSLLRHAILMRAELNEVV